MFLLTFGGTVTVVALLGWSLRELFRLKQWKPLVGLCYMMLAAESMYSYVGPELSFAETFLRPAFYAGPIGCLLVLEYVYDKRQMQVPRLGLLVPAMYLYIPFLFAWFGFRVSV